MQIQQTESTYRILFFSELNRIQFITANWSSFQVASVEIPWKMIMKLDAKKATSFKLNENSIDMWCSLQNNE